MHESVALLLMGSALFTLRFGGFPRQEAIPLEREWEKIERSVMMLTLHEANAH